VTNFLSRTSFQKASVQIERAGAKWIDHHHMNARFKRLGYLVGERRDGAFPILFPWRNHLDHRHDPMTRHVPDNDRLSLSRDALCDKLMGCTGGAWSVAKPPPSSRGRLEEGSSFDWAGARSVRMSGMCRPAC